MKRWGEEDISKLIDLHSHGLTNEEIANKLGRTRKAILVKLNRLSLFSNKTEAYEVTTCKCCGNKFKSLKRENRKFCSQSCAATVNNKLFIKRTPAKIRFCLNCGKKIKKGKFCSHKCQHKYRYTEWVKRWKEHKESGIIGSYQISSYLKRYMFEKYNNKCCICGWSKVNKTTGKIPLEIDHIDGDYTNNSEENLRLLCPNCHSLTPTYKGANKGNGRYNRMRRYHSKKSY